MRGLIHLEVLRQLEEQTGRQVTEMFDWIVGTSTGAIIALGLVYGEWLYSCALVHACKMNFYLEVALMFSMLGTFVNFCAVSKLCCVFYEFIPIWG